MAEDYYTILGVSRDASQAEIQKAYLKLARKYHPDVNPDDRTAKKRFQEVQQAFDVLKDPSKRELYDRYGNSFESMATGGGPHPGGGQAWQGSFEDIDLSQFFGERFGSDPAGGFADLFGQFGRAHEAQNRRSRRSGGRHRGADIEQELKIPLPLAIGGGNASVQVLRDGKPESLLIKIPAGVDEGKKIRLRGQGHPGPQGAGDLLLVVRIEPHPYFQRRGDRLDVKVPVSLREAAEGARIDVPTPRGTVTLKIPPGTSSGTRLRIKGHGVPTAAGSAGDLFAEIQIVLPSELSSEELQWIRQIDARHPSSPRSDLRW